MPADQVLGIIGCPILEDELVYAVRGDRSISRLFVVDNEDSKNLVRKLLALDRRPPVTLIGEDEIEHLSPEGFALLVYMKSMALHEHPERLREEVSATAAAMALVCRSILLFYGLCGNAFSDVGSMSRTVGRPITIISDQQQRPVDDCIAAVLGGTDGYLRLLKRYPGVFYLTPGWAENWRTLMKKMEITRGIDGDDLATIKWLFEMAGYKLALKIQTGLGDQEGFDARIDEFVRTFGFQLRDLEAEHINLDCVDRSYAEAKSRL
ncbi:MAG: DUF1638 domain-containing protein [Methanomassiliicoccus sp.]|nr:DUF1638 domain-containing protein [Methanomassiliicoccus sp.]